MLSPVVKPGHLTELDKFIFESWGYLIIPDVLPPNEVEACLAASRRVHATAGTSGWGQVGRSYETEPALEALIDHPAVLPKIRGLYGDRFILQSAWNTMQSAHGKMGGWHQDGSGAYDFKLLGYPIPLLQLRASYLLTDQSRPRMGNMELIPGSHRSLVTLPEVTPVSQAAALQEDLRRASIEPYAWVLNKSVLAAGTRDRLLAARLAGERKQMVRMANGLAKRIFSVPWRTVPPIGFGELSKLASKGSTTAAFHA